MSNEFSPYVDNGGTVVAVAGSDFAIIAGDTRLTQNSYCIASRNVSKVAQINNDVCIASSGMQADIFTLQKNLHLQAQQFKRDSRQEITTVSFARHLGNTLYGRRFFPYYTFNLVAGLKEDGSGAVYSYDAIGSFQEQKYSVSGSAQALMLPLLDSQLKGRTTEIPFDEALGLVKDALTSAGERDIHTGDSVEIFIMRAGQPVEKRLFELKRD